MTADTEIEAAWTVSEALSRLHPRIPRRTLERRLAANCTPLPELRKPAGRGRPAAAYLVQDIFRQHTLWAFSRVGKRPTGGP
jgi:hypothetical protein